MLSLAAFHLRNFYGSALSYLQSKPAQVSPVPDHIAGALLREPSDAVGLSRPGHLQPRMRRELEFTRTELVRTKTDVAMLEERCRVLEKTLKDTRDILRVREAEVDKVRKERDRERRLSERRRSDSTPLQTAHKADAVPSRRSSADIRAVPNGRAAAVPKPAAPAAPAVPAVPAVPKPVSPPASAPPLSPPPAPPKHSPFITAEERARQRSSEAYLTRTDSWSGAQVLQALQDINSEILQFAASATEVCTFAPTPETRAILAPRSAQAMHDTASRLGIKFARILSSSDHSQDPLLVQWALQGSVALCIARALSAFCLGFPSDADSILSQIYKRMSLAEPQPTSSKWRALTHRNIHAVYPTLDEYAVQKLAEAIVRWSADVFVISGCTSIHGISSPTINSPSSSSPPNSRTLSAQPSIASLASSAASTTSAKSTISTNATTHLRESLKTHFGDQIRRLARSTTRLATTVREEILSTSFDVIAMDHTQNFNPATMYDYMAPHAQASNGASANGETGTSVLATTELGLLCTTRIGNRESVGDEDVTIERRILLKPKVVLETVLEMLDR
ncbi:hypothetical protein AX14_012577 [Amanita brunnescens Koide BX004]|nr:hypothetical protein AX14_012577 [Amanita brunnescens Koide BX004]